MKFKGEKVTQITNQRERKKIGEEEKDREREERGREGKRNLEMELSSLKPDGQWLKPADLNSSSVLSPIHQVPQGGPLPLKEGFLA